MKWMYDELWEILSMHIKRKENEHKDKIRKVANKKDLQAI
jgi:hypothetical protein